MNTHTNDGGPAFPTLNGTRNDQGMTLRDWFAAMAMQGGASWVNEHEDFYTHSLNHLAVASYRIADAMLSARDGKGEG
jgi:hypothetical protein